MGVESVGGVAIKRAASNNPFGPFGSLLAEDVPRTRRTRPKQASVGSEESTHSRGGLTVTALSQGVWGQIHVHV